MIVDLIQILNPIGQARVTQIQQNIVASGQNASGETARSTRFSVTQENTITRFQLIGDRPYYMTIETGRKPTPSYKPSKAFVDRIQNWMQAKGLPGKAYAIAQSIHKKGTELYRVGGRKDIVSNVINQGLYDQISQAVLKQFVNQYILVVNSNTTSARP